MLKSKITATLQRILGFENFLFYFSRFKIFMLTYYRYEKSFAQFMELIPEGDVILDIGANIGITTIPLAKKFKSATLHSFEPIPQNVIALNRVIKHYKLTNVVVHPVALGEEEGELSMVLPVIGNVKKQGLSHVLAADDNTEWNQGEIFKVPVLKLDNIEALKNARKIAGIKIDVENFEYYVLKGARELLSKHKPVIYCELWDNELRHKVMDYLKELGYAVKTFENDKLVDFTTQTDNNFIFIDKSALPQVTTAF